MTFTKKSTNFSQLNLQYCEKKISLTDLLKNIPKNQPRFFMFGVPTYNNLGDQAVAEAQKTFFKKNFPYISYIEITEPQTNQAIKELLPLLHPSDQIGFVGGGNIGSFYLNHEKARRKVFSTFVKNQTISFPQSINFALTEQGHQELVLSQNAYNKNPNLVLVARESKSFKHFQKYFSAPVIFSPDMVLCQKPKNSKFSRKGVLLIVREDGEKAISDKKWDILTSLLQQKNFEVQKTDTVVPFKAYDTPDYAGEALGILERKNLIHKKLEQIEKSQVVITDRLHGLIFAVITKTPCLVFDNNYGKVSYSYYNWLKNLNYVKHTVAKNQKEIVNLVEKLILIKKHDSYNFSSNFKNLKNLIKKEAMQL